MLINNIRYFRNNFNTYKVTLITSDDNDGELVEVITDNAGEWFEAITDGSREDAIIVA
jgi:hypothetical protein